MNDLYGYADTAGTVVVAPQYKYAESLSEGLAVVGDENGYLSIDQRGEQAITGKFAAASPFFKSLANVRELHNSSAGRFAYIDRTGRRVFMYE